MHYDGYIHAAVHGPAGQMTSLADLLQKWVSEKPQDSPAPDTAGDFAAIQSLLQAIGTRCQEQDADTIVTETFSYFSNVALVVLDFIDGIAHMRPQLEWAVTLQVNFSVTDTVSYFSYFSPTGADSILHARPKQPSLEDFVDWKKYACSSEMSVLLHAVDINGTERTFDFMKVKNRCLHPLFDSLFLLDLSRTDVGMKMEEDRDGLLLRMTPAGNWSRLAHDFWETNTLLKQFPQEIAELEQMLPNGQNFDQFCDSYHRGTAFPPEFVAKLLRLLVPNAKICIVERDGMAHFLDGRKNEYFFGRDLEFDEMHDLTTSIHWKFPKSAKWIPFSRRQKNKLSFSKNSTYRTKEMQQVSSLRTEGALSSFLFLDTWI